MINFDMACNEALDFLKKNNDDIGLDEVCSLSDRWIFVGYGGGPYGNVPVTVHKTTGEIEQFPLSVVENQDLYYKVSVPVAVPEKYR